MRASGASWRLLLATRQAAAEQYVDAGGYADQDEITSGNTGIYGASPPLRGFCIPAQSVDQTNSIILSADLSKPSPYITAQHQ
jgi:hypothetical protein